MRSRNKPLSPERPIVIVVEGLDYLYFLLGQIRDREEFREVMLWDYAEGMTLRDALGLLCDQNHFRDMRAVGVITDAEESRSAAEQRVKSALESNDLPTPPQQLTAAAGQPFTGFLVMPHDQLSGKFLPRLIDSCGGFGLCRHVL
jgi:hypothetical protein